MATFEKGSKEEQWDTRRTEALRHLEEAVQVLGPITDEAPGSIREPIRTIIAEIDETGTDLKGIRFV